MKLHLHLSQLSHLNPLQPMLSYSIIEKMYTVKLLSICVDIIEKLLIFLFCMNHHIMCRSLSLSMQICRTEGKNFTRDLGKTTEVP